jgi:peptidoglycan/LPS O-acetylase OafA/YrhL
MSGRRSERIAPLDALRSCAILLVFLWHYMGIAGRAWLFPFGQYGWMGVDLFFVLSGCLIAGQLLKPVSAGGAPDVADFFLRRTLRVWPSYLFVVGLYFLLPGFRESPGIPPLWRFLTFTQNFALDRARSGAFSHAWSLCIEEQFYLLLPFLVLALRRGPARRTTTLIAVLFAAGMAARIYSWNRFVAPLQGRSPAEIADAYDEWIYYPTYARLDGLLVGAAVALIQRLRPAPWAKLTARGGAFSAAGVLLLALAGALCHRRTSFPAAAFGFPIVALGFGCLVIAALSPKSPPTRSLLPGTRWGATLAFALYLTHKQVLHLVRPTILSLGLDPDGFAAFALAAAACLAASALLYFFVERPFLLLRDRLADRRVLRPS